MRCFTKEDVEMMREHAGSTDFMLELSMKLTSITKLFGSELLCSIREHLGLGPGVILCFDAENRFLSWTDEAGVQEAGPAHPYEAFARNDVVEHVVYHASRAEDLTYFNTVPKVYRATQIISPADYDDSAYVAFLEEHFGAHYSATLAFGIYGYIQLVFFKGWSDGDFTREELLELENLYVMIASVYRNFKQLEQERIFSEMKDQLIGSSEKTYFITDDFRHVLQCSAAAAQVLGDMFSLEEERLQDPAAQQAWLPLVQRDERFRDYTHAQEYDHGIVERYHLITIREGASDATAREGAADAAGSARQTGDGAWGMLTGTEQKVAALLTEGMTYRQVAAELVVSYHTVKKHVENIYSKLGISSRYQLYEMLRR